MDTSTLPATAGAAWRNKLTKTILGHDYSVLPQTSFPPPRHSFRRSRVFLCSGLVILSILGFFYVHAILPDNRSYPTFSWTPFHHNHDSPSEDLAPQSPPLSDLDTWQTKYSPSSLCTPSNRPGAPHLISVHSNSYSSFTSHDDTAWKPFSLLPVTPIPADCLEEYFLGKVCPGPDAEKTDNNTSTAARLDIVWSWVNGSDPLHTAALSEAEHELGYATSKPKLYRDHDELKYSMRSALAAFRNGVGNFYLLASDTQAPSSEESPSQLRYGQIPQWLSASDWNDGNVSLSVRHHSQFFSPGSYAGPTFNSFAIESQLGHLCGVSENFIYMNDDFFFGGPVYPEDFYTPLFGPVLRFQYDITVSPHNPSTAPGDGEWRPLDYSSHLLSKRFGSRPRLYVVHAHKSISLPIMHEIAAGMWAKEFEATARRPFRGMNGHPVATNKSPKTVQDGDDVYPGFLFSNYLIDRAREALLWSWVIGRIGGNGTPSDNGDDNEDLWIPDVHGRRAWQEIGGDWNSTGLKVRQPIRETLDQDRVENAIQSSREDGMQSRYKFSSQDGCPLQYTIPNLPGSPPRLATNPHYKGHPAQPAPECEIIWSECFEKEGLPIESSSDMFVHVAFEKVRCGDCIIRALLNASGPLGISEFLPPLDRKLSVSNSLADYLPTTAPPHLPLASDYHDIDFSLDSVMGPWLAEVSIRRGRGAAVSVREWSMMVIQRYRYVVGELATRFLSITTVGSARSQLKSLKDNADLRLVCINDDVEKPSSVDEVNEMLHQWFDEKWPVTAGWEA
ncbi:uncharacterized protein EV420DRAFT_1521921 [Desarmillaria tabescens]|uniref:Stealth protein CR3 conserved region 3 domain-containing protein n=1 Tax=Armillaria tabescens TaxID=1929756 RepID=A0AA39TQG7_ARMTA|nr:uncharacterized protein EV420DRAFT_1521921 [Desarmillaria tabescens]KAK0462958.1 hypothetical protein EV420DRAFT_1521921 [Desarmillaria tabescens]